MIITKEQYQSVIDKIKPLIKDDIEFTFEENNFDEDFFIIKTIIRFQRKKYTLDLCVGTRRSFFTNPPVNNELENLIYDEYQYSLRELGKTFGLLEGLLGGGRNRVRLLQDSLVELSIDTFKQSREYKIRSLYDKEYERFFDGKTN
jgi:hypothetical protein